jgi:hypothetical protein
MDALQGEARELLLFAADEGDDDNLNCILGWGVHLKT